jgi:hypothetical protein
VSQDADGDRTRHPGRARTTLAAALLNEPTWFSGAALTGRAGRDDLAQVCRHRLEGAARVRDQLTIRGVSQGRHVVPPGATRVPTADTGWGHCAPGWGYSLRTITSARKPRLGSRQRRLPFNLPPTLILSVRGLTATGTGLQTSSIGGNEVGKFIVTVSAGEMVLLQRRPTSEGIWTPH